VDELVLKTRSCGRRPGQSIFRRRQQGQADGTVAKGPVGHRATGYSILDAPSLEAATKMARACPVIKGGAQIAVYETFNAM
jgi:hypothetical protein